MNYAGTNRLLDSLPELHRAKLLSLLEPVSLPTGTEIYRPEDHPRYVMFLTSGVASVVTEMSTGDGVEVGLIGREGIPGDIHLLGPHTGPTRCFMQLPGTGLRMSFKRFVEEFETDTELRRRVLEHVQHQTLLLAQIAACNRVHEVEARLARWLLMFQDRVETPNLELTQEFLGQMLGARRSTVTIVAGALQRSGFIKYSRGKVQIRDRENLENTACECYQFASKLYKSLYRQQPSSNALGGGERVAANGTQAR